MAGGGGAHRRYNPLLDEWVLCSPGRLDRPWQGQEEPPAPAAALPYDPDCYMCPGNVRAGGDRNPDYDSVFVFDNDFPAVLPFEAPSLAWEHALLRSMPERGHCRVVCFSPRHDLWLAGMEAPAIEAVIDAWGDEVAQLGARAHIKYVQIFENRGTLMGSSNPHPHGQIWAVQSVPTIPARKWKNLLRYLDQTGRDLLGDYLGEELGLGERIVIESDDWVVLVPFWAVWPYETLILPRRRIGHLNELRREEKTTLAVALKRIVTRYDNLFQTPFPYSMGWHGLPTDGQDHPEWRLHAMFLPPLLRSARVKKFLVGYELTAEAQRDVTPEAAATRLRELPDEHYLRRDPNRVRS